MKIVDVPIFDEDGNVEFTQTITADEAQLLLQFAINFLTSTGMSVRMLADQQRQQESKIPAKLDD